MLILPVRTPLLHRDSDLVTEILKNSRFEKGDILVISSKIVAMTEGAAVDLTEVIPSAEAEKLSKQCNQDPRFTEFVLTETKRMHGTVAGVSPHVLLTALKPRGMKGRILCPNAGADQSNIEKDAAVGWPIDPTESVRSLSQKLGIPVIMSDSCCVPGRLGVTAFALACSGMNPFHSEVGSKDLFGKSMRMTQEAVADQLAVAANAVMGNSAQSVPAAIIRGTAIPYSDFSGLVDGIEPEHDLFRGILKA